MPRIKGTNIVHVRDFVESSYGLEGWATVAAGLTKASRDAVESAVAVGWYPMNLQVELLHAIQSELGRGDPAPVLRAGVHSAEYDFTRIHRLLLRLANPGYLLEHVGTIWARFYDSGKWTVARPTPHSTQATLSEFDIADALYCAYLGAYFGRLFELVGARSVVVRHPVCRARGDATCRWDGEWK